MTHNENEIDAEELLSFITSIEQYVNIELKLYALGGTALTLRGIKESTKDVDINIETKKEFKYISKLFRDMGFEKRHNRWFSQEGLAFDMFYGTNILGTELLEDSIRKSIHIKTIGKIQIYILSLEDIIISKLARGDERDFIDIKTIIEKEKINLKKLIERYEKTMKQSIVANYKQKILDLIDIKFSEWNFQIDQHIIEGVKKWEEK